MKQDTDIRCKGAGRYKAVRPPACNGGNPCLTCRVKWLEASNARLLGLLKKTGERIDALKWWAFE